MNFNQSNEPNEKDMQMEQYFLKDQNRWHTGTHDLVSDNHPLHLLSLDETFFKPSIDEEESIDSLTLDSFFTDKLELNELHVSGLVSQIYKRNDIKNENLYRIDKDMMKCQNKIFEIEHLPKWYNKNITNTRNTLEKEILDLEKEKRSEYVSWWRDLVLIKKDLINTIKELKSSENRQNLVIGLNLEPELKTNYLIPQNEYTS